jgi:outer membrane protein assembly factor BamA
LLFAAPAFGQKPVSKTTEYSPYEREAIDIALEDLKREIDPSPEGKIIGHYVGVRLEVLENRDPGPELLKPIPILSLAGRYVTKPMINWLHVTSKEFIIRREFLLKEGERYVQVIIDETARNMRVRMPLQVSLVVMVPIKSKEDPGKVDILVITKDIWSLRLSIDPAVTSGGVERFVLVPQETNFLGLHHTAQTRFEYAPETLTFGVGYKVPRFGYSWIGAGASAAIVINQRRSEPEGSSVGVSVGQGLYSTRTPWAWDADASYSVGVARRYSNAKVLALDFHRGPGVEAIPWEYKARSYSASASVSRSFGWAIKNNFSISFNASAASYDTFNLSAYTPEAQALFRQIVLPTTETRVYPSFGWSTFTTNFLRTLDVNTLALQEDFRLGHDVGVSIYPVPRALGSSRDLIGVSAKAGYAVALGDGMAGARVSGFAEDHDGDITDGSVSTGVGAITPRIFGFGRLAMNASFSNRYANYLNARTFIGGEDRLRGYPTAFFAGKDTVLFNFEYRSRSIQILKAQIGGVLFFDAGDAAYGLDKIRPKQSVGFGIRTLFPQVNRTVFRLDVGFPMDRGPFPEISPVPVDPMNIFFGVDQAFSP